MYLQQYQQNINIDLDEKELWTKFYGLTNEMILTKAGRYVKFDSKQNLYLYLLYSINLNLIVVLFRSLK